jgi:hypothetical protein
MKTGNFWWGNCAERRKPRGSALRATDTLWSERVASSALAERTATTSPKRPSLDWMQMTAMRCVDGEVPVKLAPMSGRDSRVRNCRATLRRDVRRKP